MTTNNFSKIYDTHITEIYRFFYLRINIREVSEELASETFFKFWEYNKNKSDDYIKNSRAFLYKIARNLLIDYFRKNNSQKQTIPLETFDESTNLPHSLIDNSVRETLELEEKQNQIRQALSKINALYADIIVYYFIEGLDSKEIAWILDKKENNIRVLVHRALNTLKKEISTKDSECLDKK